MNYERRRLRIASWTTAMRQPRVQLMQWGCLTAVVVALLGTGMDVRPAAAQRSAVAPAPASLVFDGVTVVDVERGALLPNQRVVISGYRIQRLGDAGTIKLPSGAQVVDAHGKYLIPGLWDMHVHPARQMDLVYPLLVAYGVTGIRDAGSPVPLDTLRLWRREILAGTRVGPPRQLLSGQSMFGPQADCNRDSPERRGSNTTCVADSADAVHFVDSLKASGADMLKPRTVSRELYLIIAAEARRVQIPFGGHIIERMTALEMSDQGATILDHDWGDADCAYETAAIPFAELPPLLQEYGAYAPAKDKGFNAGDPQLLDCWKAAIARFRRNGTWVVPTLTIGVNAGPAHVLENFPLGLPLLVGTDAMVLVEGSDTHPLIGHFGARLHKELALYVAHGLTPLAALQTATLNPAKMLHATDSLGTVAAGKLADLVLLDANPLADIANTTTIRAVIANGRYFDRATLDQLLTERP